MGGEHQQAEPVDEQDLARAACAGDRDAFGVLFRIHYPRVHRTVWGILADEAGAHDVAQEAWIKAWNRRDNYNFQSAFATWVHRIAVNCALDALRRRSRLGRRFLSLFETGSAGSAGRVDAAVPGRDLENRELGRAIEAAVDSLPDEQRTVLVLREYEGYSYEEIARAVGCPTGTVMSRLHLARQKLQSRLSKELS